MYLLKQDLRGSPMPHHQALHEKFNEILAARDQRSIKASEAATQRCT